VGSRARNSPVYTKLGARPGRWQCQADVRHQILGASQSEQSAQAASRAGPGADPPSCHRRTCQACPAAARQSSFHAGGRAQAARAAGAVRSVTRAWAPIRTRSRGAGGNAGLLLLGAGSVAAIKAPILCEQLCQHAEVKVVATKAARYFFKDEQLPARALPVLGVSRRRPHARCSAAGSVHPAPRLRLRLRRSLAPAALHAWLGGRPTHQGRPMARQPRQPALGVVPRLPACTLPACCRPCAQPLLPVPPPCVQDDEEWHEWAAVGDPVMHIELRSWADCLVVAPLSANTLAKMAAGMCDNLLTCIVRAWDFRDPLLVRPAAAGCQLLRRVRRSRPAGRAPAPLAAAAAADGRPGACPRAALWLGSKPGRRPHAGPLLYATRATAPRRRALTCCLPPCLPGRRWRRP